TSSARFPCTTLFRSRIVSLPHRPFCTASVLVNQNTQSGTDADNIQIATLSRANAEIPAAIKTVITAHLTHPDTDSDWPDDSRLCGRNNPAPGHVHKGADHWHWE